MSGAIQGREQLGAVIRVGGAFVTVSDAVSALRIDRIAAAQLLARWQKQGWLSRVRRGLYLPLPLASSSSDRVIEDPWTLVPQLFDPGYVGGASAAQYWDLTEQLFRTIFVFTTRRVPKVERTVYGSAFNVRHISGNKLFGTRSLWHGKIKVQVSDIHRTILDMLNNPADGGGIQHVSECLQAYLSHDDADLKLLVEYGDRFGNGAVFKRLGFLLERIGGPMDAIETCLSRITKGNAILDPAVGDNRLVVRWRLWIPTSWKLATERGD